MNKYKNKKTGAVLETPCKISGGDWEEIKNKPRKSDKKKDDESSGAEESENE